MHPQNTENILTVVSILLGISLASELYKPTFRNSVSVPTDTQFRNVGLYTSDAGEIPKRILTTFRTRRKLENYHFELCQPSQILRIHDTTLQVRLWKIFLQHVIIDILSTNQILNFFLQYAFIPNIPTEFWHLRGPRDAVRWETLLIITDVLPGILARIQNDAFCQKNGIQSERNTQQTLVFFKFWGFPDPWDPAPRRFAKYYECYCHVDFSIWPLRCFFFSPKYPDR